MSDVLTSAVIGAFHEAYPDARVMHLVSAPGRVNLIGEHTDYNGLPVLPAALDRQILIALEPVENHQLSLRNLDAGFAAGSFEVSGTIAPYDSGDWGNYLKAAAQAVWHHAAEMHPHREFRGFRGVVGSNIPAAAGLSSSSALVVAVGFALSEINALHIPREELASVLAAGERYVGTEGGGMDQAASLLSLPGSMLQVEFNPLRVQPVPLPGGVSLVVANSTVQAEKSGAAKAAYNMRVAECRLGVQMLKHRCSTRCARLLGDLYHCTEEPLSLIDLLPDGPLTLEKIACICRVSTEWLVTAALTATDGSLLADPSSEFNVKKRCRHVFTEADRVYRAVEAMRSGSAETFGRLMDESHASCRDDYEISCSELEALVGSLRTHGATGARLTGAGFGGCAVALVPSDRVQEVLDAVWEDYYVGTLPNLGRETPTSREEVLFSFIPAGGAAHTVTSGT